MRDLPILVSGPLVRATLSGQKTETRRLFQVPKRHLERGPKLDRICYTRGSGQYLGGNPSFTGDQPPGAIVGCADGTAQLVECPYGRPGDRLWGRETWAPTRSPGGYLDAGDSGIDEAHIVYRADQEDPVGPYSLDCDPKVWRPSIHMPRWAARLFLRVEEVRVERLCDITRAGAIAEGIRELAAYQERIERAGAIGAGTGNAEIEAFSDLWDSLAPTGSTWADNPWVWVIRYSKETPNAR